MKRLTLQELKKAPVIVQFIHWRALCKIPIGVSLLEEAISNHPKYFPDEISARRRWDAIPQSVHDGYLEEISSFNLKHKNRIPPNKGIMGWIRDPKGYEEWQNAWDEFQSETKQQRKAIHDKYYLKYGIEWNGL